MTDARRIVAQFSCGAASAVATKLALAQHGDNCVILNAFLLEEHQDNRRFAADCERWFGRSITVLRDERVAVLLQSQDDQHIAAAAYRLRELLIASKDGQEFVKARAAKLLAAEGVAA
jgi:hypothetical protein